MIQFKSFNNMHGCRNSKSQSCSTPQVKDLKGVHLLIKYSLVGAVALFDVFMTVLELGSGINIHVARVCLLKTPL